MLSLRKNSLESTPGLQVERVLWRPERVSLKRLVQEFSSSVPLLLKFATGYFGRDEDLHTISADEVCWLHDIVAQQRVVVRGSQGQHYSIPLSFQRKVYPVTEQGPAKYSTCLKDFVRSGNSGKFVFARGTGHELALQAYNGASTESCPIGNDVMEIMDTYMERFLSVHSLTQGGLASGFRLVPAYIAVDVCLAVGLEDSSNEQFMEEMLVLKGCSDSLQHDYSSKKKQISYILQYDRAATLQDSSFYPPDVPVPPPRSEAAAPHSSSSGSSAGSGSSADVPGGRRGSGDAPSESGMRSVRGWDHLQKMFGPDERFPDKKSITSPKRPTPTWKPPPPLVPPKPGHPSANMPGQAGMVKDLHGVFQTKKLPNKSLPMETERPVGPVKPADGDRLAPGISSDEPTPPPPRLPNYPKPPVPLPGSFPSSPCPTPPHTPTITSPPAQPSPFGSKSRRHSLPNGGSCRPPPYTDSPPIPDRPSRNAKTDFQKSATLSPISNQKAAPLEVPPLHISSLSDIPEDISSLTIADISQCLHLLHLSHLCDRFKEELIDGAMLKRWVATDMATLKDEFGMSVAQSRRLKEFVLDFWRPK